MEKKSGFQTTEKRLMSGLCRLHDQAACRSKALKQEYRACPKGDLYIRKKRDRYYFYEKLKEKELSISRDRERVSLLTRKRILEYEINCYDTFCSCLESAMSRFAKSFERNEHRNSSLTMKRIRTSGDTLQLFMTKDALSWMTEAYDRNPYNPEGLVYMTSGGFKVRSKSEKIIADLLWDYRINFRYESRLSVGSRYFYPDFTIRRDSGDIVIWEHFGLLDDSEYLDSSLNKLDMYRRAGFKQHTNLICTDEDDIAAPHVLKNIIEKFLM